MYVPKKAIKVVGVGLFEVHANGGPFTLGFKYVIQDPSGTEVYASPLFEENVPGTDAEDHIIKHIFTSIQPIEVKEDHKFHICVWCAT